ncbi:DNA polymerase theta subunit [Monoraphidium neglectum]|uniref:DNA polymerase theta subunit n=1 Tax=Monoraphidium neglectum TaxID=145388 RepID=A0A0D2MPK7_9CHLO|nr:DNA polymerase theta subunit [Monoraphidium neglectum]KIZ04600.1 DNA polymerase theta subunit [Monoraphidium neglectum]|eukprot:XP_013903619.1 DNA polymerase theta subunit [Monoraphidium neglectum]
MSDSDDDEDDDVNAAGAHSIVRAVQRVNASQAPGSQGAAGSGDGVASGVLRLELRDYMEDEELVAGFMGDGDWQLYPWQAECLSLEGVLAGRNLVYSAPTSGGKSLVAEALAVRRLLQTGRTALVVLPYRALCEQKVAHFDRVLGGRWPVKELYGQHGGLDIQGVGVVVCTIEKAHALVQRMLEDDSLHNLGCVVVDELHMVGDEHRGNLLECMLTKIRFKTAKVQEERATAAAAATASQQGTAGASGAGAARSPGSSGGPGLSSPMLSSQAVAGSRSEYEQQVQIIGMSATLPNVGVVARWLDAALYETDYRPVPLAHYVAVGRELFGEDGAVARTLDAPPTWPDMDARDHEKRAGAVAAWLCHETVQGGHSVLMFCNSKNGCQNEARLLAERLDVPERPGPLCEEAARDGAASNREWAVAELRGLSHVNKSAQDLLLQVVPKGVAFHHADLTSEQRSLVERAFACGAVSILAATSTLAAGVNLPVRRVVFRQNYIGTKDCPLDATRYRQMAGRAGRAGIDSQGEAILLGNLTNNLALIREPPAPIHSCLREPDRDHPGRLGMRRIILEAVAVNAVSTTADVERFVKCTLLNASSPDFDTVVKSTQAALQQLFHHRFITWRKPDNVWEVLPLGRASAGTGSVLGPDQALALKAELDRAREGLNLECDLHLLYLVTPLPGPGDKLTNEQWKT